MDPSTKEGPMKGMAAWKASESAFGLGFFFFGGSVIYLFVLSGEKKSIKLIGS